VNRPRLVRLVAALGIVGGALSACTQNEDPPETATVVVEAGATTQLQLIVSTRFSVPTSGELVLVNADTILVAGNYNEVFSLNEEARFTARLAYLGDGEESARLAVLIDDRREYDQDAVMAPGGFLQYVYRFQQDVGIIF